MIPKDYTTSKVMIPKDYTTSDDGNVSYTLGETFKEKIDRIDAESMTTEELFAVNGTTEKEYLGKSMRQVHNLLSVQAIMSEKHTLREWLVLFQKRPELREEFDKMIKPKPIE